MHEVISCAFVIYLRCIMFAFAQDRLYEITDFSKERYRDPQERYVDIYTNYPDVDSVLKTYDNLKSSGRRYVYPRSPYFYNDRSDNFQIGHDGTNKKEYYNLPDDVKFDDVIQSEFGDFESYANSFESSLWYNNSEEGNFFRKGRPKFKTGRNPTETLYDQDYFSNIQKIPRQDHFLDNKNNENVDDINIKLRELLKKYLIRLYRKKHENAYVDDNKEEVIDIDSAEVSDNIETLDNTAEGNKEKFYEVLQNNVPFMNVNKSKLLDTSKLLILKNNTKMLANKFLSLFTIIQFPNSPCIGMSNLNYYEGTCYYATECQTMNGTAMGSCANGYGVCCVFTGTCGGSSSQNCTYFQSPNYPNYYPSNGTVLPPPPSNGTIDPRLRYQLMMFLARQESTTNSLSCIFQVTKSSNEIRQLRIDFLDLELRGPTNGTCVNERLVISGQNINDILPIICGYNTGQHMYIDVSGVRGPIQLAILSSTVERKRFRIRICQISDCANQQNCLQYYTGVQGTIASFNYDQASSLSRSMPEYFNNLNYAVCIRKEAGYCSITYTNTQNGTTYPFQIRNIDDAGQSTVPPGQAGAEIFSCPDDYIVINGIRLCGERLNDGSVIQDFTRNAPVTDSSAGPIIIPVRTDGRTTGRGFRLFYTQNRCPNT